MFIPSFRKRSCSAEAIWIALCAVALFGFGGCSGDKPAANAEKASAANLWVGEAVAGEGNEMAAVDLIIGDKAGPGGVAFATGLASQRQGHPSTIVVLQPNLAVKPSTLLVSRVTLAGVKSSVLFFDPVQQGVARAIADAVTDKVIAGEKAEDLVVIVSVFIHPEAEDAAKLFRNNYEATKLALKRAMAGQPSAADVERTRRKN